MGLNDFDGKVYFYRCLDISNNSLITFAKLFNVRQNEAGSKSGDLRYFVCNSKYNKFDPEVIHYVRDILVDAAFGEVKLEIILNKAEKAKLMLMGL